MSVALDDNIPEPTGQEHSDKDTSVPKNYDKYINTLQKASGGWVGNKRLLIRSMGK